MIEKESWKMVEIVIRRYPENKRRYADYLDVVMRTSARAAVGAEIEDKDYTKPQSCVEDSALRMNSAYADRVKKEIEAVEFVFYGLRPAEQRLIKERFWKDPEKITPYLKVQNVAYSERQMKRIVRRVIYQVGRYIGEIE